MAAPTERAFVATPIPAAGARVIAAPFQFWTSGEDHLRVTSVCSMAGVRLRLQGRFVGPDGVISAAAWDHTCRSDRVAATDEFALGVGAVLNLVVFVTGAAPKIAQVFVIVQLIRGRGAAAIVLGTLLQGYCTSTQVLAWPGSPLVNSLEPGYLSRTITGTTPAAGVDILETVPTGARWELISLRAQFVASAASGSRSVACAYLDGGGNYLATAVQPLVLNAGLQAHYTWGAGLVSLTEPVNSNSNAPLPTNSVLPPGAFIRTWTSVIQPGDQWTVVRLIVREWLEVA